MAKKIDCPDGEERRAPRLRASEGAAGRVFAPANVGQSNFRSTNGVMVFLHG